MQVLKLFLFLTALTIMGTVLVRATVQPDVVAVQADAPIMQALIQDTDQVEEKLIALAGAIPASSYDWRPGEGVRSVSEVLAHVAADNWFLPTAVGVPAPEATGIEAGSYESVQAYEARKMSPEEVVAELRASFQHLEDAMSAVEAAGLNESVDLFGQQFTELELWVLTTTHLHEHLGQLIAYARSNEVVPPWSG